MSRILVLDDEPLVRQALADMLQEDGYDTLPAASVLEAIEAVETQPVDLAIVDILMPGVDGLEAVKAIARRKIPVVAMSGRMLPAPCEEFDGMRVLATRLGADYCLPKPFRRPDVLAAVAACGLR